MTTNRSPEIHARNIKIASYLLLGLALAIPLLMASVDAMNGYDIGLLFGQMVIPYIIVGATIRLTFNAYSITKRSYVELMLSMGLLAWSATVSISAWHDTHRLTEAKKELIEAFMQASVSNTQPHSSAQSLKSTESSNPTDKQIAFIRGVQVYVAKWGNDMKAIEQKFAAIDLSSVLKPENITSNSSITASRQKIRNVEAIINERQIALQRYLKDCAEYFRTVDIDESTRRETIRSFEAGIVHTLNAYDELRTTQLESLKSVVEMLDFAEKNLGRTSVKSGQITFETQTQWDQYLSILANIQQGAQREEAVNIKMIELQKTSRNSILDEYNKN
ncbi:MAG: hypothetical protein HRU78_08030 [Gammaproteobacteria bacterium]|nr:MAG: hypothetical protein HRU78_08030 [Gammaproteobacteria bacterium]